MKKTVIIVICFILLSIISVASYYDIVEIDEDTVLLYNRIENKDDLENQTNIIENNISNEVNNLADNDMIYNENNVNDDDNKDLSICNENGDIMILMYHKFSSNPTNDEWTRTFSDFKKDLETLYENNYRPISMTDYLTNNINVPYGMTPVVLTFDDGSVGQLAFDKVDGELVIRENTAVKILQDFNKEHPDFELKGTFYITATNFFGSQGSFGQRLTYLTDLGFEIGNLTKSHYALGNAKSAEKVQEEVGGLVTFIQEYLPGYSINSLSLPGGSRAKTYESYMYEGSYKGTDYKNLGVVSIYNYFPAKSPTNNEVNFKNIPRIKVNDSKKGLAYWIEYFKEHPEEKYVSEG